ncbi:BglG family transcription antiterminator [Alkalihalobacillus hwajinpoensis]|uniref:BglG family transcription antiterminator n=1 Tax=Guptibacillus hwajinpoensis TaxID=208199 RepID=UPI00188480C9|nr:BglG family transcription antiterminator [Pseudalkalibacillus hwajinpoensis]MBF0706045.1 BglG family transcription antiterminator [Pseudalkalibacillus hwajinpoensis]
MSDFTLDDKGVELLEIVRKRDYSSLDFIAESLGVGTRTIRNHIKKLNSDLEGIALLKNKRGKGYWLSIEDTSAFELALEQINAKKGLIDSPKRRIALIIDRLINSEKNYTLDDLAFEMNIGRTTLVNELKKASVSLESYNLKVYGKPNTGMNLSGDELDLRFFILENVYDLLYDSYPLDEDIVEEIYQIANRHDFESSTRTRLMQFIVVMLDRLLKNHPLEVSKEKYLKLLESTDYQIGLELAAAIEAKLPVEIPLDEILFITIPIAGRRTPTNNRTITEIRITDDVKRLLETIVEQIGFNKETIKENQSFFTDLQYHLTFMLNRLMFGFHLKNPMLEDVKEKYPVAFRMAQIAGKVIEKEYELKVSDDELGYIAFYFGVFTTQSEVRSKRLQKAAIICGTGRGTAKLVANQLRRVLNQNTQFDLFSESDVTEEILNQYDIIFSTLKLSFEPRQPIIVINEIFDEQSVSRKIEEVAYRKSFKLNEDSKSYSILNHLISEEKFFVLNSEINYHENLYNMVDELVKANHLDKGFKERLKKREEKGSMIFDRFIALPHTFNYQSAQIELALGIFPDKVVAEGKELNLVLLLGIPEHQTDNIEHQLVNIYDEIIQMVNDESLVEKITNASSYEDLTAYLRQVKKFD